MPLSAPACRPGSSRMPLLPLYQPVFGQNKNGPLTGPSLFLRVLLLAVAAAAPVPDDQADQKTAESGVYRHGEQGRKVNVPVAWCGRGVDENTAERAQQHVGGVIHPAEEASACGREKEMYD